VGAIRLRVAVVAASLLFALLAPVPVLAATPTTTVLSISPADPEAFEPVCFLVSTTVTDDGSWVVGGDVLIYETTSGSDVFVGHVAYQGGWPSTGGSCYSAFSAGPHTFRADYIADATFENSSDILELDVPKRTPDFFIETEPESPEAGSQVEVFAGFATADIYESDSLEIHMAGVADPICSQPASEDHHMTCMITAPSTPGTYELTVSNSGSLSVAAGTSEPWEMVVQPNTVRASGVGVQYATFYPVKDSYRDTVAIRGTRTEPLAVTIKIHAPGGGVIKTQTIASGSGTYSYAWNGRKTDGSIRPEGTYKVTQTLVDGIGASQTYTDFVTLSKDKLVWRRASITKDGSAFSASGKDGDGSVAVNESAGSVRLRTPNGFGGDWAGVGYQFALKGIAYRDVKLSVLTTRGLTGGPSAQLGAQDFDDCPSLSGSWSEGCFDAWVSVSASSSKEWSRTKKLDVRHFSGNKVRSMVSNGSGTTFIYKAKVTYEFATLES
jgi:hypothetical protein